jgi:hypothetical protein
MLRRLVVLVGGIFLGACAKQPAPTAPGTKVLDFTPAAELRVSSWSLGAGAGPIETREEVYRFKPHDLGRVVRFGVKVEHGVVELHDAEARPVKGKAPKPHKVRAPRHLSLSVNDSGGWMLGASCEDKLGAPLVRQGDVYQYPTILSARCRLVLTSMKRDVRVVAHFQVDGDGAVTPGDLLPGHRLELDKPNVQREP